MPSISIIHPINNGITQIGKCGFSLVSSQSDETEECEICTYRKALHKNKNLITFIRSMI